MIGYNGISSSNYNDYMLSLIKPEKLNVLTIHAEIEGIACVAMFDRFVKMAKSKGIYFVLLKAFLADASQVGRAVLVAKEIRGREGWVSCQAPYEVCK